MGSDLYSSREKRLADMPKRYRATYVKAMTTKSKAAAIKAMCQQCMGWDIAEITICTAPACPLYPHRPYQSRSTARDEGAERRSGD